MGTPLPTGLAKIPTCFCGEEYIHLEELNPSAKEVLDVVLIIMGQIVLEVPRELRKEPAIYSGGVDNAPGDALCSAAWSLDPARPWLCKRLVNPYVDASRESGATLYLSTSTSIFCL